MKDDPKPTKSTVYVDVEDDITAIIGKVESAKQAVVALVLPKRSTVLQSIVNMRLLKRSADSHDKQLVLVTSEAALLPLAGAAGIATAKTLQSKPGIPAAPIAAVAGAGIAASEATLDAHRENLTDDEPETIDLDDEAKKEPEPKAAAPPPPKKADTKSKAKVPNFDRFKNRMGLFIVGGIALILLFIIGGKV